MSRFHPFAQLVRLPNVFTALADICLAALAAAALPEQTPAFIALLLASACLYSGGMVWNDFFDLEQDRKERPFRPLPSGRIHPRTAAALGGGLLIGGLFFAALADLRQPGFRWTSTLLAAWLCVAILLYDGWLKRTWAGPVGMGLCRALNVLLGLSVAPHWVGTWGAYLALVVGIYITGVTLFARKEAGASNPQELVGAGVLMLGALVLALALPPLAQAEGASSPVRLALVGLGYLLFPYLLVALGFVVGFPVCRARSGRGQAGDFWPGSAGCRACDRTGGRDRLDLGLVVGPRYAAGAMGVFDLDRLKERGLTPWSFRF